MGGYLSSQEKVEEKVEEKFEVTKESIAFNCVVLSRLSYFTSNHFLSLYLDIFGPIIPETELEEINKISFKENKNILKSADELSDAPKSGKSQIFKTAPNEKLNIISKKINALIKTHVNSKINSNVKQLGVLSEVPPPPALPVEIINNEKFKVAYISIATSNYSGCYILVDTRMPDSIFIIFRGTYSQKSAAAYLTPSSVVPYYGNNKKFAVLNGIAKLLSDTFHSIIESMVYLSRKYLINENKQNPIKVFTTGHSLGGGLATLFANRWGDFIKLVESNLYATEEVKQSNIDKYYKIFDPTICCVAIASPRVFNKNLANDFCNRIKLGNIIYTRLKTRGDPVPGLPPDKFSFAHPCSGIENREKEKEISVKSKSPRKIGFDVLGPGDSEKVIDWEPAGKFRYEVNPFSHTNYYYINFANAVDLSAFAGSYVNVFRNKIAGETSFYKGLPVARFLFCEFDNSPRAHFFKEVFIILQSFREENDNIIGIDVASDKYITKSTFETYILKNLEETNEENLDYTKPLKKDNYIELVKTEKENIKAKPDIELSPTIPLTNGGKKTKKKERNKKERNKKIKKKKTKK